MPSSINRSGSISELLEPAMEGPPSPETLRAISNQMRLASTTDKHQSQQSQQSYQSHQSHHSRESHQTTSSGSSSLRSLTSVDRPSWDKSFDNSSSLSRKSSSRSTSSTAPRDRHESVQIFGKNIFGKRGILRRESSAPSSSNSSLHSAELPFEKGIAISSPPPPPLPAASSNALPTSNAMPSFFSRRRAANKSGPPIEDLDGRRRLQISGPYNFQHLTHTHKEQLPNLQRGSRVALQSEFALSQSAAPPVDGKLLGIQAESLHFPNFSSETLPIDEDAVLATVPRRSVMRPHAASVSSVYPPPQLNYTKSQDQLRIPPPRPPRSPAEASSFSPPIPPPRFSSRASLRPGDLDSMATSPPRMERPRTSGGFRQPTPSVHPYADMPRPPLMHSHSYSADTNVPSFVDTRRFSQMPEVFIPPSAVAATTTAATSPSATPDDSNWPLAAPAAASASTSTFDILPGVPEEEEQVYNQRNSVRKSRMSVASNRSSLRKSHSLPLLQQFPVPQSSNVQRPPSAASDTLGRFDLIAAQRLMREESQPHNDDDDSFAKANWEDDIDYCYEHEIEADCEYAWDRPSMDLSREEALAGVSVHENNKDGHAVIHASKTAAMAHASPHLLSPGCFDMPALSPASQSSMVSMNEAVTPTALSMRRPPGLTIQTGAPEEDALRPMQRFFHGRSGSRGSRASSFKESHGFNLSPSLFIPGNDNYEQFRPPVRGAPVGFAIGAEEEDEMPTYVESTMTMNKSMLFIPARTSASTTASHESRDSVLSDRHISANSTATDLTRLTMSTASIEDLMYKKDLEVPQI
ncbi:pak-box/p21-Rho-binding protein [Sporothrix schenckii 1099-18]|uniref:CRIB domain-containing protein n=2 Tax=Sporothrix schenckii TaxID=29908 RepID=U7PNN0_SPOS1|nr:pak-box/p21-Rho-binding protein [Sporothrix schenckii 1099-18]ERS97192.1 hypothetical protein HMPREF1624_06523 [Sporothrix schenckii ATCC 58251]KJR86410.1 pak-box/p21-Rho-binding protein [Sporothrix schenckii 1099-18]